MNYGQYAGITGLLGCLAGAAALLLIIINYPFVSLLFFSCASCERLWMVGNDALLKKIVWEMM